MIEVVISGITMGLIVLVSVLYRGRRRVNLLRIGCIALFAATACRGVEPSFDVPGLDLLKRCSVLTAQVCVVLIVLTFRCSPIPRRTTRNIVLAAAAIALGELALVGFLPVHADGTVFHQSEVAEAASQDRAWALVAYHCLYLIAFAAAAAVVAVGCWRAMVRRNQPLSARIPVACIFAGALGSFLFIGSSIMDLFGHPVFDGSRTRNYILIAVVTFFFAGLAAGVIRRVSLTVRKTLALHVARELVVPLWKTTTTLHPDVRLPPEEQQGFSQAMTLSRLTIETHDALRLIREDDDPALRPVHDRYPEDPRLSAELVRHLSGEKAVPPLGWFTVALSRLRTFELQDDESLATSIESLYEIRLAMSEQTR